MIKDLKVSRRYAIRGALAGVGVSLWLPVLDAMCNDNGDAFAQGDELPTTFGIWFWGNGVHKQYWQPNGTGAGDSWQLPEHLSAFADVKEYITFLSGMDMMDGVFKGHGWGNVYTLAGGDGQPATVTSDVDRHQGVAFERSTATQYVPTIDQIIADAIGQDTPFASLETGIMDFRGIDMGTTSKNLAHRGPHEFLPPEKDPRKLFDRLFGNGVTLPEGTGPSVIFTSDLRRSALDAVLEDARRLQTRLGTEDSARIDAHMETIRAVEQRIESLENPADDQGAGGCALPETPNTSNDVTERSQAIHRLVATALACNLTRVYTHLWSGGRDDNTYPMIGINEDHHGLTHGGFQENERAAVIEKYIMDQYADMVTVLKDTPVGGTTLLVQTLLYGVSDVSEPTGHVMADYHVVLAGLAGGKLAGNMHHAFRGRKLTELQLTMLQTMGLPIDNFGSWDNTSTTVQEILA